MHRDASSPDDRRAAQNLRIFYDHLLRILQLAQAAVHVVPGNGSNPKVPILHLGVIGPLHRRDIYDDAR